jgi:hypothetical protein
LFARLRIKVVFGFDALSKSEYDVFSIMITKTWSKCGNGAALESKAGLAAELEATAGTPSPIPSPTSADALAISAALLR